MSGSDQKARNIICRLTVIGLLVLLAIVYFIRNENYSVDDSFITYRYAFHLMQGDGLVFNVGEKYYGTTAAGYAIFLAGLNKIFILFDQAVTTQDVAVFISSLSLLVIVFAALYIVSRRSRQLIPSVFLIVVFAGYMFMAWPFNEVAGHETYAFLALAFVGIVLASVESMLAAGMVIAVSSTFRPDAVLFAPVICLIYVLFKGVKVKGMLGNKQLILFSLGFFFVVIPWLVFLQGYFGRVLPGTMDAKKAQILIGEWPIYDAKTLLKYVYESIDLVGGVILSIGAICFGVRIYLLGYVGRQAFEGKQILFVGVCWLAFLILSVGFYLAINVTFWRWYGIPVVFSIIVIAFCGFSDLVNDYCAQHKARIVIFGALVVSALLFFNYNAIERWVFSENINPHTTAYFEVADFLKKSEPNGTVIEMAEPGAFGMRLGQEFTIVDELGLITPGVAKAYLAGDTNYANRVYKPKYIICSWRSSYSACAKPEVILNYDLVGEFDVGFWRPFLGGGAKLYRKNSSNLLPLAEYIRNPVLGEKYGIVRQGAERGVLFVHPGDTPTSFEVDAAKLIVTNSDVLPITIMISPDVPSAAVALGGATAGVTVYLKDKIIAGRRVIKLGAPLSIDLSYSGEDKYMFVVDNNGVSNSNWVLFSAKY